MAKSNLTAERVRELLNYDLQTGIFTWRIDQSPRNHVQKLAGSIAGFVTTKKAVCITIDSIQYYAHRVAFLYVTGSWPKLDVDHKDTNSLNNEWTNLRDASTLINLQNQRMAHKNNKLGILGVYRAGSTFRAEIRSQGRKVRLGRFKTPELAYAAYLKAKRELHAGCTI